MIGEATQQAINASLEILKIGRTQLKEGSEEDLTQFYATTSIFHERMREMMILIKNLSDQCNEKSFEARENAGIREDFGFVYRRGENLSWGEMSEIENSRLVLMEKVDKQIDDAENDMAYKNVSDIDGVNVGNVRIPTIARLNQIPPSIYWYAGDRENPTGLYISVCPNLVVKIPLPEHVDGIKEYDRVRSIKCKYVTIEECRTNRKATALKYKSKIRECTYAHKGDRYRKIGTNYRAQIMPRFGARETLADDILRVTTEDIKKILMNSLSDLLLCRIWGAKTVGRSVVFSDIDRVQ